MDQEAKDKKDREFFVYEIKEELHKIISINVNSLSRKNDPTQSSLALFDALKHLIDLYKGCLLEKNLEEKNLDDFFDEQLKTLGNDIKNTNLALRPLLESPAQIIKDEQASKELMEKIIKSSHIFIMHMMPFLIMRNKNNDIETLENEIQQEYKEIKYIKKELEEVRSVLRDSAGEMSVSKNARYFGEESKKSGRASNYWLFGIITFSLVFVYIYLYVLFPENAEVKRELSWNFFHFISNKVITLTVFLGLFFLAIKTYTAHQHNTVVNRHRANALSTYYALVEASGEEHTKNIILSHAASCIFSPQETGFSNKNEKLSSAMVTSAIRNLKQEK